MAKFTLLEVHLEDASFTANAPYSGASGDGQDDDTGEDDTGTTAADGDSGGRGKAFVGLLVVVAILALAYLGSRKLGGEDVPDMEVEAELET
ncbi:MAG: hypothetical protein V5A30_05425 [Haloarculaceae archaeon]